MARKEQWKCVFINKEQGERKSLLEKELANNKYLPPIFSETNSIIENFNQAIFADIHSINVANLFNLKGNQQFHCLIYISAEDSEDAVCSFENGYYLITISYKLLCRIVLISQQIDSLLFNQECKSGLHSSEDMSFELIDKSSDIARTLEELMYGIELADSVQALKVSDSWQLRYVDNPWGSHVIFYDLVRMILFHELCHCIYGHLDIAQNKLGLSSLKEHNDKIEGNDNVKVNKILQCFEFQADQVSIACLTSQLIRGLDPAMYLFYPLDIDLTKRLSVLNISIMIFSAVWSIKEIKNGAAKVTKTEIISEVLNNTHPPAALRYANMSEYMLAESTRVSIRYKISDLATPELFEGDIMLHALLNQKPIQSMLEVITRYYSTIYLSRLNSIIPYLKEYSSTRGAFRFSRRLDKPLISYKNLLNAERVELNETIRNSTYFSRIKVKEFEEVFFYPGLIIPLDHVNEYL